MAGYYTPTENSKTCKDVHNKLLKRKSRLHNTMYSMNPCMQQNLQEKCYAPNVHISYTLAQSGDLI